MVAYRHISVSEDLIDTGALMASLEALGGGGIASFTGLVRGDGGIQTLRLEHYPAMTEAQLGRIVDAAIDRWPLLGITVVHRVGDMATGDRIVFVATCSAHRQAALESCAFLIDWLKSDAPFWKVESFADGTRRWVEPRASDDDALNRWKALT